MSISLSVSVMAHPRRRAFVDELVGNLDRNVEVVWDRYNDRWDTGSRAMRAYDSEAAYHMVIQDDVIVCRDLIAGMEQGLSHLDSISNGFTPVCLYIGRRFKRQCRRFDNQQVSWFTMPLYWGQAIVMPVELIDEAVRWGDKNTTIENYDLRLGEWLRRKKIRTWYPWPSLVDHRTSPSLVPGRGSRGRYATRFVGEDFSALDHDWSGRVVHGIDQTRASGKN